MSKRSSVLTSVVAVFLATSVSALEAQHVVWVDFTTCTFDLAAYGPSFNTSANRTAVQRHVLRDMARDYANFDVQLVTFKPPRGRYTRIQIGGRSPGGGTSVSCGTTGGLLGTSLKGSVTAATGHGSWRTTFESRAFMFSDRLSDTGFITSQKDTTVAKIGNAIGYIASHELGHIFGLEHWHAFDDYTVGFGLPQSSGAQATNDVGSLTQSDAWPFVMTTSGPPAASGIPRATYFTTAFRFSPHISNEKLMEAAGTRGYHLPLANFNSSRSAELLVGEIESARQVAWHVVTAREGSFGPMSEWIADGGDATDIYLTGDLDGDGDADLLYGRPRSATTVTWYVRRSNGSKFGGYETWASDAGDVGDVFRIGDVNGDGKDDLTYGRPQSNSDPDAIPLTWYVRTSNGDGFDGYRKWLDHGGYQGHPVFVRDFDRDNKADLVAARIVSDDVVRWSLHRSSGAAFGTAQRLVSDAGDRGDRIFLDDVTGDERPDLVYGRRISATRMTWYMRAGNGSSFRSEPEVWISDAGNSGDVHRLGDVTGDGLADLVFVRRDRPNEPVWYVSPSNGRRFTGPQDWRRSVARDGFLVF